MFLSPSSRGWAIDLLHNSRDTASTKWQESGGWGVAGGKYGEFTCATCHEPNVFPNIKNIRSVIRTPDGSNWPGGSPEAEVRFLNVTSMGNDRDGHTTSTRVCEVCHSLNRFHNADTARNIAQGGNLSHPTPQAVCTTCHKHNTGFKAACGGCHGNPPTTAELGGDYGLIGTPRPSRALVPGEAGAHATHTQVRNMVCDTCHFIDNGTVRMPNLSNTIDIGFFGFSGTVKSGTYIPYTTAGRGYRIGSGTAQTTIAPASADPATANLCVNVYCHGGGSPADGIPPLTGGVNTTPRWDGASQNACGNCHGTTADRPVTTGGHLKHAGSAGGYSFACDLCHPVSGDNSHVQGNLRWSFKESDPRTSDGKYRPDGFSTPETAGSTGKPAPSSAYGDCSSLYCHSDGRGHFTTPTWGGALPSDCTGCHGNGATSSRTIGSRGHTAHVANTSSRFAGFNFRCDECHAGMVDAAGTTIIDPFRHVNGQGDVSWGTRSTGGLSYATNGCTQIYCHSNGQGAYKSPPRAWNDIPDGEQGTISCDYCHGGTATDSAPISSMRHTSHIGNGPLPHRPVQCNWCHSHTVGSDGHSVYNGMDVSHINRSIDVTFLKMANFSGSYNPSTRVCSSTWCHGNGSTTASRDWDTTTVNTCGNCHEANNSTNTGAKLSDAHRKHYNTSNRPSNTTEEGWMNLNLSSTTNVFMCGVCHPGNPSEHHVNGPATPEGSAAELSLRLPFAPPEGAQRSETVNRGTTPILADGRGYQYSTGTTCDTYCHSDGRGGPPKTVMAWGVTTASCGNCHNKYGDDPGSTTWSGSHNRHLAGSTSINVTCNACHAATAADNTTLLAGRRDRHPNGFRNVTGNSLTASLRWDPRAGECSNVYCHFNRTVTWGGSLPGGCIGCHGGLASSPEPIVTGGHKAHVDNDSARFGGFFFTCADCHASTTSTNDTISDPALHANGTANVVWGARGGGTGSLPYDPAASCTVYCHSNGAGTFKSQPKRWRDMTSADEGTISCDYCHNGLSTDQSPIASGRHTNHIGNGPLPHRPIQCNWCHSNTVGSDGVSVYNGAGVRHINRSIDVTFLKLANFSGIYDSGKVCTNTYCHGNNTTTSVRDWDTTTVNTCGNCHEANNSTKTNAKLSDAHLKHYNTSTRPSNTTEQGWSSLNLSATTNVFMCGVCHPGNPTVSHVNGPPEGVTNGSVAEVVLRLPFTPPAGAERPETVTRGNGVTYDGRGYGYSTGTTCDTYCHSDARGNPPKTVMAWAVSTSSCGNCHNQASDNPLVTTWSKPHDKHANAYGNGGTIGSNNTTTNNTFVTCAACHASTASSNTALLSGQRAKHPNGFRNVSASSTVGSAAFRWDPSKNSCKNGYCHSRAYSFSDYSTPWIRWDMGQDVHCGSCHTSYPTGPDYPNGYKGKANSHPTHAVYWGFSCDWCHSQTVAFRNVTAMYISTVRNHVNKNYNVVANSSRSFIGKPNTFTATATTSPPAVATTCSSVACHGGNTSKVFVWGGSNGCGDCHLTTSTETTYYGFSRTPTTIATINSAEWGYSGHGKGTGTYDVTGNPAANFPGAVTSAGDQCLFCHDYSIGHGTASNPLRLRNFSHPTWGKNGVCLVCHASSGATGVDPDGAGTVYTLKSAARKVDKFHYGSQHAESLSGGQFCWDCHDAHGDRASATDGRPIAMIQKKPVKRSDPATGLPVFFTATTVRFTARSAPGDFISTSAPYRGVCNVCHDYKPDSPNRMVHYTATSSDGHQSATLCTTCHKHSPDAAYDGQAYAPPTSCNACHDYDTRDSGRVWGMNPISPVKEGFGAHAKHIQYIKNRWGITLNPAADVYGSGAAAAVCGVCHSNLSADHTPDTPTNPRSITFGGSTARRFGSSGPTYNGNSSTSSSVNPKSCSSLDCHYRTSPVW